MRSMILKEKGAIFSYRIPPVARTVWWKFTENSHESKKPQYIENKRSSYTWFDVCFLKGRSQTSRSVSLGLLQIPIAQIDTSFPRFRP